jgi:cyclopropane-fatty-acyl-phospholipid synthase
MMQTSARTETTSSPPSMRVRASAATPSKPAAARAVLALLQRLRHGVLDVQLPTGEQLRFGATPDHGPQTATPGTDAARVASAVHNGLRASLCIKDWRLCAAVLKSGDIGFAEAWIEGHWTSPDVVALLTLFIANREAIDEAIYGHWWGVLLHRAKHLLNRNSKRGAKKNIHAHYDIGNPFYRLWLDETMNYSSAWFAGDLAQSTAQAQLAKVRRALNQCQVQPGQRLLEIGCGWGALAETAARENGVHVTGVTLSSEQLAYAQTRLRQAGLASQSDLRLQDYRDLGPETFDAVVSIEMFEAVGQAYWDGYFNTVQRQLKPGGLACIQTITIKDDQFERYVRGTDFIQQYIFPGGLLPSRHEFVKHAQAAGLEVVDSLAFGADYAETLRRWRASFLASDGPLRQLGFDTRFMRIWEFYLAYCEAAFATGSTDVVQFTLRKPA